MISVIVPTITGREEWLRQCLTAYAAHTTDYEVIVVDNRSTCGEAWNEGASLATGEYLHFTADDLEPHAGWWQAAIGCVEAGAIPSARILNANGTLQSCGTWGQEMDEGTETEIARVPFVSREQWARVGPSLETHYYTDNWVAMRAQRAGIRTLVTRAYLFTHHFAPEGRLLHRMDADYDIYNRALVADTVRG